MCDTKILNNFSGRLPEFSILILKRCKYLKLWVNFLAGPNKYKSKLNVSDITEKVTDITTEH